jgi:glycerol-3-phosphate acyltransferase PlsY
MSFTVTVLSFVISYLIGSISFARLVTKWWAGKDVTEFEIPVEGTEDRYKVLSIGGNSVSSVLGPKAGMTAGILDILKVILPTLAVKLIYPEQPEYTLIAALGGLIGHIWPIYYRFHGGSGFSAILGGLFVIDWVAALISPVAGLILGTGGDTAHILYAVAVNILFLLAMIPDIQKAMQYKKEGKYIEYGMGSLKSHPMGRGMLKMAKFFGVEIK